MPGEMARVDELFLSHAYDWLFCPVMMPDKRCPVPPILSIGLDGYMMLDKSSVHFTVHSAPVLNS